MWFKKRDEEPGSPPRAPGASEEAPRAGFWARTWAALNKPVFDQDEEWAVKTRERLKATRKALVNQVQLLVLGRGRIDDDLLDELEAILLTADLGVATTEHLLTRLRALAKEEALEPAAIPATLRALLRERLGEPAPFTLAEGALNVILFVGVNGVGKTTTIGKLAARLASKGRSVIVAAGDTFRAAAIDQVVAWGERAGVEVIRHQDGADAAAVVFDALAAAKARGKDVVLVDTAGRLHNKANLMEELSKIRRVIERAAPEAAVQALLVLDATTGQNGLKQAAAFQAATGLTGVALTKLDGTAKGGVVFAIRDALGLPVQLVGLGEKAEDLGDFDPDAFTAALFDAEAPAGEISAIQSEI